MWILWCKRIVCPFAEIDLTNSTRSQCVELRIFSESAMDYELEFEHCDNSGKADRLPVLVSGSRTGVLVKQHGHIRGIGL